MILLYCEPLSGVSMSSRSLVNMDSLWHLLDLEQVNKNPSSKLSTTEHTSKHKWQNRESPFHSFSE